MTAVQILAQGHWRESDVEIVRDLHLRRETCPQLEDVIERTWGEALEDAKQTGKILFDGTLCRLARWEASETRLSLHVGPTSYREYLGTNARREALPEASLANPLSVCSVIRTVDGRLIAGRRAANTMESVGSWHLVAGHVDWRDETKLNAFAAMRQEIAEELGIGAGEIVAMECLGLGRPADTRKPELLYRTDVSLAWADLEGRGGGSEHSELAVIEDNVDAVEEFIAARGFVPIGVACLRLHCGVL